jgi:beta-N-acetylhexosaminidase
VAARRGLTVLGSPRIGQRPLVIELHDEPSIAIGAVPWGVGRAMAARVPGTVVAAVRSVAELAAVLADPAVPAPDSVLVCVRDTRRRPWQAEAVAVLRAAYPSLIVVDHGTPSEPALLGQHAILTHDASAATAEAAVLCLEERRTHPSP